MRHLQLKHLFTLLAAAILGLVVLDESWLMPGPVSSKHAEFESRCELCHPGFEGTPNSACLSCKDRMSYVEDRGIHRYAPIGECAICHVEHRTRSYPLASAWIDPRKFDHRWTGFELGVYHQELECRSCHSEGEPHRAAQPSCSGCHDDFVQGIWHHAATGCSLDALHSGLLCDSCHVTGWGAGHKPQCDNCHNDDVKSVDICTFSQTN